MTTRGRRASARIFSTGSSKISGGRRSRTRCSTAIQLLLFELEAGGQSCLGDLDLLWRRLGSGQAVLQLVPRLGERAGEALLRVADHPAEDLRRGGERDELRAEPDGRPDVGRSARCQRVAERGRGEERCEEMRAAALVLLLAPLTMLVTADRDVLRTVIGRNVGAAQSQRRRGD